MPLIVGGSGASLMPANVLRLLKADYVVVSDGEKSFVQLLECIQNGETPTAVPRSRDDAGRVNLI